MGTRAPQKIIIDGYNVIYTHDGLRRTACKDLQRARERLLDLLKDYLSNRRVQATVVFDGRAGFAETESIVPGKLQVIFSAGHQTADELILATIRRSKNPRSFIVVSSDMADIGRTAKGMGCEVIGSKRFLDRLTGDTARGPRDARASHNTEDTDYWLKLFDSDAPESQD